MNLLSIPDEQLPEDPPFALLTAARAAVPVWLTMCVRRVA